MTAITTSHILDKGISELVSNTSRREKFLEGFEAIREKHGNSGRNLALVISGVSTAALASMIVFSGYGVYELERIFIRDIRDGVRPPIDAYGHTGEWSSQIIQYAVIGGLQISSMLAEGSYRTVLKKTIPLLKEQKIELSEDNAFAVYNTVLKHLKYNSEKGFLLQKSPLESRSLTIKMLEEAYPDFDFRNPSNGQLSIDYRSKEIFKTVQEELQSKLSFSKTLSLMKEGLRSVGRRKGRMAQVMATTMSVAVPILLVAQAALSFIGAKAAYDDVFVYDGDNYTLGHMGEWPANGIAFLYMATYFVQLGLVNTGSFETTKKYYSDMSSTNDQEVDDSLQTYFEEHLLSIASQSLYGFTPNDCRILRNSESNGDAEFHYREVATPVRASETVIEIADIENVG
ncbi:MAG: hypothetical protein ACI9S8_002842 [Chlamydiales bacterium]|jgi:hypothetical protein